MGPPLLSVEGVQDKVTVLLPLGRLATRLVGFVGETVSMVIVLLVEKVLLTLSTLLARSVAIAKRV